MKRTYVRVVLEPDASWRIGSWQSSSSDALETLIDRLTGHPMVPGSGITGSLRADAEASGKDVALFGPKPASQPLSASPWWVLGVVVDGANLGRRGRTRIDRVRNSAALKGKFVAEEARGGSITVYLRSETESVDELLVLLRGWEPRIGGARSTGLGRARVTQITHRCLDLSTKAGVLEALAPAESPVARADRILAQGHLEQVGEKELRPLVSARVEAPFVAYADEAERLTRGSQWKGILRSRVEFIGRSLGYADVCGTDTRRWEGCGHCAVCRTFGSTTARGTLEFLDSPWQGPGPVEIPKRYRNAIDRFTGGVRDGGLFPQRYERDVVMRLHVLGTLPDGEDAWVGLALQHALRDLDDGLIGIGPEGAVGYGTVKLCETTLGGEPLDLATLPDIPKPQRSSHDVVTA